VTDGLFVRQTSAVGSLDRWEPHASLFRLIDAVDERRSGTRVSRGRNSPGATIEPTQRSEFWNDFLLSTNRCSPKGPRSRLTCRPEGSTAGNFATEEPCQLLMLHRRPIPSPVSVHVRRCGCASAPSPEGDGGGGSEPGCHEWRSVGASSGGFGNFGRLRGMRGL